MISGIFLVAVLVVAPSFAQAYIGPGLGAGAIAAAFGVIGSIFLALFAVIYYPVKKLLKKRRAAAADLDGTTDTDA